MMKKILFPVFLFLAGCTNTPATHKGPEKVGSLSKHKPITVKSAANPWSVKSYAGKSVESKGKKYVRFDANGNFSDSTRTNDHLYAEIYVDKVNAGIFLHESQKSGSARKFTGPVQIIMTDSDGKELKMTSSRPWNQSGGILVERNNNDYSQFRIFLLQSDGLINVEIRDEHSSLYHFNINARGFSESFSQI